MAKGTENSFEHLKTIAALGQEPLPDPFYQYASNSYAQVLYNPDLKALIIEALNSYIPIEEFKSTFEKATDLIKTYNVEKVIFDKRPLRTFHQPSMEWYFITWKTQMFEQYGIRKHVKLLPDLPWFKKAVEAGKAEIFEKYPANKLDQLAIHYKEGIQEALQV